MFSWIPPSDFISLPLAVLLLAAGVIMLFLNIRLWRAHRIHDYDKDLVAQAREHLINEVQSIIATIIQCEISDIQMVSSISGYNSHSVGFYYKSFKILMCIDWEDRIKVEFYNVNPHVNLFKKKTFYFKGKSEDINYMRFHKVFEKFYTKTLIKEDVDSYITELMQDCVKLTKKDTYTNEAALEDLFKAWDGFTAHNKFARQDRDTLCALTSFILKNHSKEFLTYLMTPAPEEEKTTTDEKKS